LDLETFVVRRYYLVEKTKGEARIAAKV